MAYLLAAPVLEGALVPVPALGPALQLQVEAALAPSGYGKG